MNISKTGYSNTSKLPLTNWVGNLQHKRDELDKTGPKDPLIVDPEEQPEANPRHTDRETPDKDQPIRMSDEPTSYFDYTEEMTEMGTDNQGFQPDTDSVPNPPPPPSTEPPPTEPPPTEEQLPESSRNSQSIQEEPEITENGVIDGPSPRLITVYRVPNFKGFGVEIQAERGKPGHFLYSVESGSPACEAGLLVGDKVISANGVNVRQETHEKLVKILKENPDQMELLVVDKVADSYYMDRGIEISADLPNVTRISNDRAGVSTVVDLSSSIEDKKRRRETLFYERNGEQKRIDYVLAYEDSDSESVRLKRLTFQQCLEDECLELEITDKSDSVDGKTYFVLVHGTWDALGAGAEVLNINKALKMPKEFSQSGDCDCMSNMGSVGGDIIPEEEDYFTAPFVQAREYQFDIRDKDEFFTNAERSLIVREVLNRTSYTEDKGDKKFGINKLLRDGIYQAAFPLHDGPYRVKSEEKSPFEGRDKDRKRLYEAWASPKRWFYKQPLDLIREYYGEKIAIYFTWLGFYTQMLIPAALVGLAVFIYGCATLFFNQPSNDICDATKAGNLTMCPQCQQRCPYWFLRDSCLYSRITYLFDNEATVAFAVFMALWATTFTEFWKRKQRRLEFDWDVKNLDLEERPTPDYEAKCHNYKKNPITQVIEPYVPFYSRLPRTLTSFTVILFMMCLVLAFIFGIIVYRFVIVVLLYAIDNEVVQTWSKLITSITASIINLIIILILNQIYRRIAEGLTKLELHRTYSEFEDSFTYKMYMFQFVNFYGSLFYIAFFKGKFIDRPGDDQYLLFGNFKPDECDPAGCLIELCIQLLIVMVGKQAINNMKEIFLPFIKNWIRKRGQKDRETEDNLYMRWEQDLDLETTTYLSLFEEYLEMVIQFGFVTLFVAAFPLAPLFALLNNILEIRLDAYKFVTQFKRPDATKAQDIGVWSELIKLVMLLSIVTNAFLIAWTTDFIPKMVYTFIYSEERSLSGYIEDSLSVFNVSDFTAAQRPIVPHVELFGNLTECRYRDYRFPPDSEFRYEFTRQYWHVFAGRLAFIIVFEHVIFILTRIIAMVIPDTPADVKQLMIYEYQLVKKLQFDATFTEMRNKKASTIRRENPSSVDEEDKEEAPPYQDHMY